MCDDEADVTFAFFKQHTLEYFVGLLDRELRPLMLRVVEQNDALYHAALAVASMHKTIVSRRKLNMKLDDDQYAVKQYTKALRFLSPDPSNNATTPIEVVLIACLLFISFEVCITLAGISLLH
jgi:hypothetical protein